MSVFVPQSSTTVLNNLGGTEHIEIPSGVEAVRVFRSSQGTTYAAFGDNTTTPDIPLQQVEVLGIPSLATYLAIYPAAQQSITFGTLS